MITMNNDRLDFSFPQIGSRVKHLVDEHLARVLPAVLGRDRDDALREWSPRNYDYRHASAAMREKFDAVVAALDSAKIADLFRNRALARAGLTKRDLAFCTIAFMRTLRIPDDGRDYPLPPGLGYFPLRHVDDFSETNTPLMRERGGVMMPMYQAEALWLNFHGSYPMALKIATGKINAVSGESWRVGLHREPQDYVAIPEQPWLDGFCVGKGVIRQFVAMPLGSGYSAEEQLTGGADVGGIQIQAYPLKADVYFEKELRERLPDSLADIFDELARDLLSDDDLLFAACPTSVREASCMGLGAGGRMRQEIYKDSREFDEWDTGMTSRSFVHLLNALIWREVTGANPPHPPVTAKEYKRAGLPWFDFYRDDLKALDSAKKFAGLKSIFTMGKEKKDQPLPDNSSVNPQLIIQYGNARRPTDATVREGAELRG
jgi:hypothetical protein